MAQKGNITCNAICPGYVLTDLVKNQLEATSKARGIPKVRQSYVTKVIMYSHETSMKLHHICAYESCYMNRIKTSPHKSLRCSWAAQFARTVACISNSLKDANDAGLICRRLSLRMSF